MTQSSELVQSNTKAGSGLVPIPVPAHTFDDKDRTDEAMAWRFLLPPLADARVACIGPGCDTISRALTNRCADVTVADVFRHGSFTRLPFADAQCDLIIFPRLTEVCGTEWPLDQLVAELHRTLAPAGALYTVVGNRWSYQDLKARVCGASSSRAPGLATVQRALRAGAFNTTRVFPLILDQGDVSEVLLAGRYLSVKNTFRLRERIKECLLRPPLLRAFAPGFGVVACKNGRPKAFVEDLLSEEIVNPGTISDVAGNARALRYHVLHQKAIISVGVGKSRHGDRIIVLPLDDDQTTRRRHEASILDLLHSSACSIERLVPRSYGEGTLHGYRYFVQDEIPGISVDVPVRHLRLLTEKAASLLMRFHRETAVMIGLHDEMYHRLVEAPIDLASAQLPEAVASLQQIRLALRRRLHGQEIPVVWTHGDYKLENVLFDLRTRDLCGVIDWDLSQPQGLPLLDLLYLLAYNRVVASDAEMEEGVRDLVVTRAFSASEGKLLHEYRTALALATSHVDPLAVLFYIYHLAFRIRLDRVPPPARRHAAILLAQFPSLLQ